ncbi:hypothetical protein CP973_16880 [Streptomyces albofaciens JCM 4342]|uniref:hypothetical protein n=1 Tax=Streptomyces albofaciens TaxID=66866 RepID=UPI00123BE512|nr:hypothetical protein [Streptomyces albofaciens]KAA6223370.1 hypothetical protein CP973_16880 [Streptomyces albofaciens JCM 4342]
MFRIPAAAALAVTTAAVATGCVTVAHRPAPESLQPRPVAPAPSVEPIGPEVTQSPRRERPGAPPSGPAARRSVPAGPPASGTQRTKRPQRPQPESARKGKGTGREAEGGPKTGAGPRDRRFGFPWQRSKTRRPAAPAPGLCALAREYGRWQGDDRTDEICRRVYGG